MAASLRLLILLIGLTSMACASSDLYSSNDEGWRNYVTRFISAEGRVIDTGSKNVSHTEGQGWAMLMAVAHNDRGQFDQLWHWTDQHLRRHNDKLFSWRYDPSAKVAVADTNNASDGDLMIAWALSLAGQRWGNHEYRYQASVLRREIRKHLIRGVAGYTVLLPAKDGFVHDGYTVINLSYFVIPAIQHFARIEPDGPWSALLQDSKRLLEVARFGPRKLPADWVQLSNMGELAPAQGWPVRFGFEAVRIPLYFFWGGITQTPGIRAIRAYWEEQGQPPAWVDLLSGEAASYSLSDGGMAVRQLLVGFGTNIPNTPSYKDDYYSASLLMLARLATRSTFVPLMY
jgi:endo-1,4-beta-D-glucanase Y